VIVPALAACNPLTATPSAEAPGTQAVGQGISATRTAQPPAAPPSVEATPSPPTPGPESLTRPEAGRVGTDAAVLTGQSSGNPLAGHTLFGPNRGAAQAAERLQATQPADAALLTQMASVPTATWLGSWIVDVTSAVRQRVAEARAAGAVPVFVTYNVPDLDCGGHSASGDVHSAAAYDAWVRAVAAGIGTTEAVVIVEPDTLALLCGVAAERYRMLLSAIRVLEANPGTHTYLDAGHSHWVDASTMAQRLRDAGVDGADGFALNVSNFETTADNVAYGGALSALLGGAHFVVDTSRNGNGPGSDWCNPSRRALGQATTTQTGRPLVDAFIWVKTPGESDGTCNGGPAAGQFWPEYALGLARG
jgi:endoglucanase